METSLKTGFAQIFSCCPKNLSCPKFGGAAAPLAPPARTPMFVPSQRVGFLSRFGLETGIHFAYFELESGMVFEGSNGSLETYLSF